MRTRTLWSGATLGCALISVMTLLAACEKGGAASNGPEPVISLSIDPAVVVRGSLATLQWSAANATECLASGEWYGKRPISGTEVYTSGANGKMPFTLTCTGAGGPASKTVKLTVYRAISPP